MDGNLHFYLHLVSGNVVFQVPESKQFKVSPGQVLGWYQNGDDPDDSIIETGGLVYL